MTLQAMGSLKASSKFLLAWVIFVLGFAELGSSHEHNQKPKDHSIAPKVFIIDMVRCHIQFNKDNSIDMVISSPPKGMCGTVSPSSTYWLAISPSLVYRHCIQTFIVPPTAKSVS